MWTDDLFPVFRSIRPEITDSAARHAGHPLPFAWNSRKVGLGLEKRGRSRFVRLGSCPRIHGLGNKIPKKNMIPTKMIKGQVMSMPINKDNFITLPSTLREIISK
jgi:hypothetical protein